MSVSQELTNVALTVLLCAVFAGAKQKSCTNQETS